MSARISWLSAGMTDLPASDAWMDPRERARIDRMRYTKRRDEARLSRWTAKMTIARALGLPHDTDALGRITVRNATDGAPEVDGVDEQIVIAMTDRADWSVCCVLHGPHRVGCDLELVEPRSTAFVRDYFTEGEQRLVSSAPREEHDLLANLLWSAKESVLKVLRTGLRRDTRSVEVRLLNDEANGWQGLEATFQGKRFRGWWIRFGPFLLTCAADHRCAPPQSLVEPPPLASASPSHAWLRDPLRSS